jgi:hypothetical protein
MSNKTYKYNRNGKKRETRRKRTDYRKRDDRDDRDDKRYRDDRDDKRSRSRKTRWFFSGRNQPETTMRKKKYF